MRLAPDTSPEKRKGPQRGGCGFTAEEIAAAPDVKTHGDIDAVEELADFSATPVAAARRTLVAEEFRHIGRALRRQGLTVKVVEGWQSRGRDGLWDPIGVGEHHTASAKTSGPAPCLGIVTVGRPDLEGPLCNFLVSRPDPHGHVTIYIVAAGRCNHMGEGGPLKGIPEDSGNAYLIGVEVENDGRGEPWGEEQLEAMAILDAVLLKRMDAPARMVIGHKEWTSRKIDPFGISMRRFRRRVRRESRRLSQTT